jgi:hypothetical protein
VEQALLPHPGVNTLMAFACPHTLHGEAVAIAVQLAAGFEADGSHTGDAGGGGGGSGVDQLPQLRLGLAELRRFGQGHLSMQKLPERLVLVDAIPKGPTGKPQRIGFAAAHCLPPIGLARGDASGGGAVVDCYDLRGGGAPVPLMPLARGGTAIGAVQPEPEPAAAQQQVYGPLQARVRRLVQKLAAQELQGGNTAIADAAVDTAIPLVHLGFDSIALARLADRLLAALQCPTLSSAGAGVAGAGGTVRPPAVLLQLFGEDGLEAATVETLGSTLVETAAAVAAAQGLRLEDWRPAGVADEDEDAAVVLVPGAKATKAKAKSTRPARSSNGNNGGYSTSSILERDSRFPTAMPQRRGGLEACAAGDLAAVQGLLVVAAAQAGGGEGFEPQNEAAAQEAEGEGEDGQEGGRAHQEQSQYQHEYWAHAVDKFGSTGLMWAAGNGHLPVVAWLVEAVGVAVDATNKEGRTALQWASKVFGFQHDTSLWQSAEICTQPLTVRLFILCVRRTGWPAGGGPLPARLCQRRPDHHDEGCLDGLRLGRALWRHPDNGVRGHPPEGRHCCDEPARLRGGAVGRVGRQHCELSVADGQGAGSWPRQQEQPRGGQESKLEGPPAVARVAAACRRR